MTDEAEKLRASLLRFVADARELKQLRAENAALLARVAVLENEEVGPLKESVAELEAEARRWSAKYEALRARLAEATALIGDAIEALSPVGPADANAWWIRADKTAERLRAFLDSLPESPQVTTRGRREPE